MKSKVPFEPEFRAKARRWCWPIRSIGLLMIVVALIGLTLWGMRTMPQRPGSGSLTFLPSPATMTMVQGPIQIPSAQIAQPKDRFEIVARPDLDAGMVIQARPDLDAGMVINPGTHNRSSQVAPLVGGGPYDWYPIPPVIPRPRPR